MSAPVLILAGGTGGHIFPGLAVAEVLARRGVDVVWMGSEQGLENTLVPRAGIALERIAVTGLRGKGWRGLLRAPLTLMGALLQALRIVARLRPRGAVAFGGYASGPGGLACRLRGVPLIVHEQNSVPGSTNRVLARLARRVLAGFEGALPGAEWVGNPVRAAIATIDPPSTRLAGRDGPLRLLVLGGSQGARAINRAVPQALATLPAGTFDVRHQTGARLLDEAREAYAACAVPARVEPFIDDMAQAYGWADLVVCRAGALTLAELCAAGVGAVLIPFPHAVDDHQTRNAQLLERAGAALLLPESDQLATALATALRALRDDPARRLAMAQAARGRARPDAAARIADVCLEEARA